jgi:hypothetical protein
MGFFEVPSVQFRYISVQGSENRTAFAASGGADIGIDGCVPACNPLMLYQQVAKPKRRRGSNRSSSSRDGKKRHHFTLQFDRHRIATAIQRFAVRNANPALTNAIFLNVFALHAFEANANPTRQNRSIVETTFGVDV